MPTYPFITVSCDLCGYFALKRDLSFYGYEETTKASKHRYPKESYAITEAKNWAKHEKIPYKKTIQVKSMRAMLLEVIAWTLFWGLIVVLLYLEA